MAGANARITAQMTASLVIWLSRHHAPGISAWPLALRGAML
jgi:hypothetical protein